MARCENCDAELQPEWKFCIFCGTSVDPARRPPVDPARPAAVAIPAAIRPESEPDPDPPRRIDIPLVLGIALGIAGLVLIGYLIVTFGGVA